MFKFAVPALAALGLVAVAAQSQATNAVDPSGMGWHLSHEGAMAKLAYGLKNSDQLALMMTCEPGQSQAVVYGDALPRGARLVNASMDVAVDPLSGGLAEESRIGLSSPTIQRLVRHGQLAVETEIGADQLTANRDERRVIAGFVAYCASNSV
jgi:hypothetical protein